MDREGAAVGAPVGTVTTVGVAEGVVVGASASDGAAAESQSTYSVVLPVCVLNAPTEMLWQPADSCTPHIAWKCGTVP
eukprot:CAMPEP_0206292480 /NCGR_PEP_ID=MMETSP0106_2-20121207/3647_1 /ASSEMBLY_ACC=CAM_ASM_000206 /TAXON_ID=81532 /ORGANISM="Acanthoeca-like sp., Strain 10tr" /LENGTH=77 /DNA_ID=CAMNT_0053723053 /DNA_START=292 /DNA_END=525 /DNA_ORIENTATION=-